MIITILIMITRIMAPLPLTTTNTRAMAIVNMGNTGIINTMNKKNTKGSCFMDLWETY